MILRSKGETSGICHVLQVAPGKFVIALMGDGGQKRAELLHMASHVHRHVEFGCVVLRPKGILKHDHEFFGRLLQVRPRHCAWAHQGFLLRKPLVLLTLTRSS